MAQNPSQPLNVRGAVDLGALSAQRQAQAQAAQAVASAPAGLVVTVSDTDFETAVLDRSIEVPVVLLLVSSSQAPGAALAANLTTLATEYGGRFLLASMDTDSSPMVAQALQLPSVPAVVGFIKTQPVPLFQGSYPIEEIRGVLDQLLELAAKNGVTGTVAGAAGEPVEAPTDPRLDAVFEAIESGDFNAAEAVYKAMLRDNPADAQAKAGLAQVALMRRTDGIDALAVQQAAAAAAADDVAAQLAMADLEMVSAQVPEAFARLIATLRVTVGAERESVRVRLVEFFEIAGPDDPAVPPARKAMASALF